MAGDLLKSLRAISSQAAFNRWSGLEVLEAEPGRVALGVVWREEFGQYSGYLHAGMLSTLIDTACGVAAVTSVGSRVLAAHFSVNCLRPAVGERFVARARVVKPGKSQVFTHCELFAASTPGVGASDTEFVLQFALSRNSSRFLRST